MHAKCLFIRFAACLILAAAPTASLLAQQSWTTGTFSYDAAGNITAIGNDTYFYDTAGRLVHGTAEGTANYQNYAYDGFGNRLRADTTGKNCAGNVPCGGTVSVNTNNRIDSAGFSYDSAGNMKSSGGSSYDYDGAGMMSSLTAPNSWRYDYVYTADDERIATYTGSGNWQFTIRGLDGKVLREMTAYQPAQGAATWTWSRDHVWRDGQLLATVSPSGTEQFHLDHLGTPRLVTDAAGHKTGYHAYYPFGEELNLGTDESPVEKLKFTGHERDTVLSSSLDYMHARFNCAGVARFLSIDPVLDLKQTVPEPQLWNRYAYVGNNPISFTDPNGKERLPCAAFAQTGRCTPMSGPAGDRQVLLTAGVVGIGLVGPAIASESIAAALMSNPSLTLFAMRMLFALSGGDNIEIPGPVNSEFGKAEYLLGQVPGNTESAGKGGFFSGALGFTKETLVPALKSHLMENVGKATVQETGVAGVRVTTIGKMTGPNGTTAFVKTVWQVVNGKVRLITAVPTRPPV